MSNATRHDPLDRSVQGLQGQVADLRRSRKRLVDAADADRRAIERSIHDGVQQYLVAFAVDLRRLRGLMDRDPAAARALLDELSDSVREALDETTALAQRIHPPMLEARGLARALRSAAEGSGATLMIDIPADAAYPPEVAATIYWSCIEALSSAPPGSEATISVREADGVLTFEIETAGHLEEDRLDRLKDRIEAFDGDVDVERHNDAGTKVQARVPFSR